MTPVQRVWVAMPFMHSEELADQEVRQARRVWCRHSAVVLHATTRRGLLPSRRRTACPPRCAPPQRPPDPLLGAQECVRLFEELAADCGALGEAGAPLRAMAEQNIKYAIWHRDVVQQWGRFPHRNAILGRPSTAEEEAGMLAGTIPKF